MFYGLSQAGRALTAARIVEGAWKPKSHGIGEAGDNSLSTTAADFRVKPRAREGGAFQLVAAALGSSALAGPTRLGDLWPLLPEARRFVLPLSGPHRLVGVDVSDYRAPGTPVGADIWGVPASLGVQRLEGDDPSMPRTDWGEEEQRVANYLSAYPAMSGYRFGAGGGQPIGLQPCSDGTSQVRVYWSDDDACRITPEIVRKKVAITYAGHTYAYPCLDGTGKAIHPLVVWWATLFGLSILARYEPQAWGRAIDVNKSSEAVAVEHILDAALDSLPELVLRTLLDED